MDVGLSAISQESRAESQKPSIAKVSSSIGRASVSKTEGWGFESLLACQIRARGRRGSRDDMKVAMLDTLKESPDNWFGRARQFLVDVRAELGRVTWPTRREVWATTVVVILVSLLFGIYLYVVDLSLSAAVAWIFERVGR